MTQSTLYVGSVSHRRLRPKKHRLRYRVFWTLFDLDELPRLARRLLLFSHNRFNLFSFHDADHGDGRGVPLRNYVERELAAHHIDADGGSIKLLCMPRILGYVFNPISIYFCYRNDGSLAALLYEVRNTFGEMHSYLISVADQSNVIRQCCAKDFHVSPFMDMEMNYDFRVTQPGNVVAAVVAASDRHGAVLVASLAGRRRELTDAALALVFVTHPLLTLKVVGAIHWEALKLFLKGVRLRVRPPAPERALSFIAPDRLKDAA
jgi:uncharacterized protein